MKSFKSQQGLAGVTWIFIIAIAVIMFWLIIKIAPVYIENYSVIDALNSLNEQAAIHRDDWQTDPQASVTSALQKRFMINNITRANMSNVTVEHVADGLQVRVQYDVKVPLLSNVSLDFSFDDSTVVHGI